MLRILVLLASLAAAAPAGAAWERFGETVNTDIYIDRATIEGSGPTRTLWVLNDRKKLAEDGEKSRRVQLEFECAARRWRTIGMTTHLEPMGRGRATSTSREAGEWKDVPPQGQSARAYEMACGAGAAKPR